MDKARLSPDSIRQAVDAYRVSPDDSHILVVDDEASIRELMSMSLGDYPVATASDVVSAKQILSVRPFRVVIADKNLPDGTGLEIVRHVKAEHPNTEFLIMTGYASVETAVEAIQLGAFGYLLKPFQDMGHVVAQVEAALARNEAYFKNELLIKMLQEAHEELFRKQVELDIGSELLETTAEERSKTYKSAIADLLNLLGSIAERHEAFIDGASALLNDKRFAKKLDAGPVEHLRAVAGDIARACDRYTGMAESMDIQLSRNSAAERRARMRTTAIAQMQTLDDDDDDVPVEDELSKYGV